MKEAWKGATRGEARPCRQAFLDTGRKVTRFMHGYEYLQDCDPVTNRLERDVHGKEFHKPVNPETLRTQIRFGCPTTVR